VPFPGMYTPWFYPSRYAAPPFTFPVGLYGFVRLVKLLSLGLVEALSGKSKFDIYCFGLRLVLSFSVSLLVHCFVSRERLVRRCVPCIVLWNPGLG